MSKIYGIKCKKHICMKIWCTLNETVFFFHSVNVGVKVSCFSFRVKCTKESVNNKAFNRLQKYVHVWVDTDFGWLFVMFDSHWAMSRKRESCTFGGCDAIGFSPAYYVDSIGCALVYTLHFCMPLLAVKYGVLLKGSPHLPKYQWNSHHAWQTKMAKLDYGQMLFVNILSITIGHTRTTKMLHM